MSSYRGSNAVQGVDGGGKMTTLAAQKIHEAEAHIAAIDRELHELDAALPYAGGCLRRQVRDARSLLIQDRMRTLVSLQQLERPPRN